MGQTRLDRMIAQAAAHLVQEPDCARTLPLALIRSEPHAPALEIVVALCSAAAALEGFFATGGPVRQAAAECWRMAALLAADIHAARCLDLPHASGQDLLAYWERHDRFFLDPPS